MFFPDIFPARPSDLILIFDFLAALFVAGYFALGKPRVWFKDRLGWVIFGYSMVTAGLLFLIVYGIAFGQPVDEWARILFSAAFAAGIVAKGMAMHQERREGRLANARPYSTERSAMSTEKLTVAEIKDATVIWYKAQRVLRTLIQVVIPSFLGFAVVLPMIIEAAGLPVDSELRLWLLAVAGGVTAVAGGISRIMAIPAVNAWLIKIGLGSVPASALAVEKTVSYVDADGVHPVPFAEQEKIVQVVPDVKDKTRIGAEPSPIAETGDDRG